MNGWPTKKRKSEEYESGESEEEGSEPDFGDDEEEEHVPDESEEEEEEFEEEDVMDEDLAEAENPSFIFKFPIKVSFDENSKVQHIPGSPAKTEKHKHPRAVHRNVVVSDDSETSDASPREPIVAEPEPPAADEISVATKRMTPAESQPGVDAGKSADQADETGADANQPKVGEGPLIESPPTPSSEQATSLAIRGSPEITKAVPRPVSAARAE
jgi:hypothetical protein